MPILAQDIANEMRFALDAEGADYYTDAQDIVPAINAATDWVVSVINSTIGQKKLGEEIFRDLTVARVFQASGLSRVSLSVFPSEPWTILAILIKPTTSPTGETFTAPADYNAADNPQRQSFWRNDQFHNETSCWSATRLTAEEWGGKGCNPFQEGYAREDLCESLRSYAYLDPLDYAPRYQDPAQIPVPYPFINLIKKEVEIRPSVALEYVTIMYVEKPTPIANLTDYVQFPHSIKNLLFNKALQYISYKQGDQTNLNQLTSADIALLAKTIM